MRKSLAAIALVAATLTLGACGGGATVDNQEIETVPPLTKGTATASEILASTSSTAAPVPADEEGEAQDGAAQEVSAVPTTVERSEKERQLLDELEKQGIKVDGVEEQMISTADGVCQDENNLTVGAIAGQLVEQNRTDKTPEEVIELLVKTAKDAYC